MRPRVAVEWKANPKRLQYTFIPKSQTNGANTHKKTKQTKRWKILTLAENNIKKSQSHWAPRSKYKALWSSLFQVPNPHFVLSSLQTLTHIILTTTTTWRFLSPFPRWLWVNLRPRDYITCSRSECRETVYSFQDGELHYKMMHR